MRNEVGAYGTLRYRLLKSGSKYRAAYWCDCLFGPHWHELGLYRTKKEAHDLLKSMKASDG